MENNTLVKRKREKKIRAQPIEKHWTSFEVRHMPEGKQLEIADALHAYVRLPNKYTLTGFVAELRLSRAVWDDWVKRYPIIGRANEEAKLYMGAKRFDAGASRQGVESLMKWAGQYDPSTMEYLKHMEEMRANKDADKAPTNIVINMADFSDDTAIQPHMIAQEEEN